MLDDALRASIPAVRFCFVSYPVASNTNSSEQVALPSRRVFANCSSASPGVLFPAASFAPGQELPIEVPTQTEYRTGSSAERGLNWPNGGGQNKRKPIKRSCSSIYPFKPTTTRALENHLPVVAALNNFHLYYFAPQNTPPILIPRWQQQTM